MYGMVNEGIRCFIEENHGREAWDNICQAAGIGEREFDRLQTYDDAVTYGLVGAICDYTGLGADAVLEVFGRYWVGFSGGSNLGNLMRLAGDSFVERVTGLDEMHDRVLLSMPHLRPPSFEVEDLGANRLELHYYSDRPGLAPMVVGLLHGLAEDTGEKITVRQTENRNDGADHDVFEIELLN